MVRFECLRRSVHNQERVPAKKLFESPLGLFRLLLKRGPFMTEHHYIVVRWREECGIVAL